MKNLPSLGAKEVIRILKKFGFEESRQKGIKKPLLRKIIEEDAGISIEEFLDRR